MIAAGAAQGPSPAQRRVVCRAADVRLLVPRDVGVEHRAARDPVEVHRRAGRRQSALRATGRRRPDRRADAPLHQRHRAPAAPAGDSGDAVRHHRRAGGVLGSPAHRRGVGHGGVLFRRPGPRAPAHQPVLDARQRSLRCPAGEAPLRAHRGRLEPRRRPGRPDHGHGRPAGRLRQPLARRRGHPRCLHRHRPGHRETPRARRRSGLLRRGARRAAAARPLPCCGNPGSSG